MWTSALVCIVCLATSGANLLNTGTTTWGRLPTTLWPIHYDLYMQPDIYTGSPPFYFTGSVSITFEAREVTPALVLNVDDGLTVVGSSLSIVKADSSPVWAPDPQIIRHETDTALEFLEIFFDDTLYKDAHYTISMDFSSTMAPSTNGLGLYWDFYWDNLSQTTIYLVATQFESSYARRAFPCFDEPEYKATFNVSVARKHPNIGLSNTPVYATSTMDDWVIDHYETTPKMSTYLVAIIVADFDKVTDTTDRGVMSTIWFRRGKMMDASYALSIAANILEFFETWTGIDYPISKIDHIALPSKGGAMENWGLITYGEDSLLFNSNTNTLANQRRVASIISHELAHQWFGNVVTAKWWDDIWLNEGFASYFETLPMLQVLDIDPRDVLLIDSVFPMLNIDDSNRSTTVRREIKSPWNAWASFSHVAYMKGGALLQQMSQILGSSSFQAGMRNYLTQYSYGNAVTDDLFDVLTEQAETDGVTNTDGTRLEMKEVMQEWFDQIGYPHVKMTRNGQDFDMAQNIYLDPHEQELPSSNYGYSWHIPITYHNQDQVIWRLTTYDWMNRENKTMNTDTPNGLWAITNVRATGYYMVDYDDVNFQLIADALDRNIFEFLSTNRASFIRDAFTMARTGEKSETLAMEMTRFLDEETTYLVWHTMVPYLAHQNMVFFNYPNEHRIMMDYWRQQSALLYETFGWNWLAEETIFDRCLRVLILEVACGSQNEDCLETAHTEFHRVADGMDINILYPDKRLIVYCYTMISDEPDEWNVGVDLYRMQTETIERRRLLSGLACNLNETVMENYIQACFNESVIYPEDVAYATLAISRSFAGRQVMWMHLWDNWRTSGGFPPGSDKYDMYQATTAGFSNSDEILAMQQFMVKYPAEDESEQEFYLDCLEKAWANQRWEAANWPGLRQWYNDHTSPSLETTGLTSVYQSGVFDHFRETHEPDYSTRI